MSNSFFRCSKDYLKSAAAVQILLNGISREGAFLLYAAFLGKKIPGTQYMHIVSIKHLSSYFSWQKTSFEKTIIAKYREWTGGLAHKEEEIGRQQL